MEILRDALLHGPKGNEAAPSAPHNKVKNDSRAVRTQRGTKMSRQDQKLGSVSRRTLLRAGAGLAGGAVLPSALTMPVFAVGVSDKAAIGTWPAGSEGDTVSVGAAVPRTG